MDNQNITELFRQADEELKKAKEELYKPAEDVVNYSVCVSSRKALYSFLNCLYVISARENNDPVKETNTIKELVEHCRKYNDQLNTIDFSDVYCRQREIEEGEEEFYHCNDVYKVKFCTHLAEKIKEFVTEKDLE